MKTSTELPEKLKDYIGQEKIDFAFSSYSGIKTKKLIIYILIPLSLFFVFIFIKHPETLGILSFVFIMVAFMLFIFLMLQILLTPIKKTYCVFTKKSLILFNHKSVTFVGWSSIYNDITITKNKIKLILKKLDIYSSETMLNAPIIEEIKYRELHVAVDNNNIYQIVSAFKEKIKENS